MMGLRKGKNGGAALLGHPFDVRQRGSVLAVKEVTPSFDAFGGASHDAVVADCFGTLGTAGTFGTAGGTLGTGATVGTFGCYGE